MCDGRLLPGAVRRINVGGKALTNYFKELVSYRYASSLTPFSHPPGGCQVPGPGLWLLRVLEAGPSHSASLSLGSKPMRCILLRLPSLKGLHAVGGHWRATQSSSAQRAHLWQLLLSEARVVTARLSSQWLRALHRSINMMEETYLVDNIKEQVCFVSTHLASDLTASRKGTHKLEYVLPDGVNERIGYARKPLAKGEHTEKNAKEQARPILSRCAEFQWRWRNSECFPCNNSEYSGCLGGSVFLSPTHGPREHALCTLLYPHLCQLHCSMRTCTPNSLAGTI